MNVYEASRDRLKYIFKEFDNVIVSFSGGKDSGVMLNLALQYAKTHNVLHKLAVVHMDYEAQYQYTTDYVDDTFKFLRSEGVEKLYWLCIPIHAQCACRMDGADWIPWEKSKRDIWTREMPQYDYVVNEDNMSFNILETDFEIPKDFFRWFTETYGKTVSLVGIRTQESFDRQLVVKSMNGTITKYKGIHWIVDNAKHENLFTAYPIYDWKTEDIWTANAKFNFKYNKLYDIFYQAGVPLDSMRVASPFNDAGIHTLSLYKVIDPRNWAKMVGRVNGASFAGIYGGTTAMGWRKIKLPKGHTWKSYFYFLLSTLDEKTRNHYLAKFESSKRSWKVGGAMDEDTIADLKKENAKCIFTGKTNNRGNKDKEVVIFEDYLDDTTCKNFARIPTYKRMCICIMKNDYYCKYMGFAQTKTEIALRKNAMEKYQNL